MMGSMKPKRTSFEDVLLPALYWLLLGVAALWLFYLCLSSMPVWMAFFVFCGSHPFSLPCGLVFSRFELSDSCLYGICVISS